MEMLFRMTQAMSVFVVIAYIYCKSPLFRSLTTDAIRTRDRIYLYLAFSSLSILGTYLGVPVHDAIANTRAIGPVLAGYVFDTARSYRPAFLTLVGVAVVSLLLATLLKPPHAKGMTAGQRPTSSPPGVRTRIP